VTDSPRISLYLLAGGRSSRFGSDKALARAGGKPLILRVLSQFSCPFARTVIVTNQPSAYRQFQLPLIPDPVPNLGPIGGLLAACRDRSPPGWILLSGCDTLFSTPAMVHHLLSQVPAAAAHAIAFKGQLWEPLPALYHTSILPTVESQIAAGQLSLWRLLERVPHCAIPLGPHAIRHVNTPDDLRRLPPELTPAAPAASTGDV
jgi:molybdenum cofactor guanylyltransferase